MARLVSAPVQRRMESEVGQVYNRNFNKHEKKLAESVLYDSGIDDDFRQALVVSSQNNNTGTIYTGATGQTVAVSSGVAYYEVNQLAVASAAVVTPYTSSTGLVLKPVAAADALEVSNGITSKAKPAKLVSDLAATPAGIFMECSISIATVSSVTTMAMGFRKAAAYTADFNDYTDMAAWDIGTGADGRFNTSTIIGDAATVRKNSGATAWADAETHVLRVELSKSGAARFLLDGTEYAHSVAYAFTSTLTVIPFLALDTETGDPVVTVKYWRVGNI